MRIRKHEQGDTIIEVIMAGAVLALVTVSTFSIMQRGAAGSYDALERSQVRLELNRQAEMLQYFRDGYTKSQISGAAIVVNSPAAQWQTIVNTAGPFVAISPPTLTSCAPSDQAFFVRFDSTSSKYLVYPKANYTAPSGLPAAGNGVWIEQVNPNGFAGMNRKYHDFYILACWQTTTASQQNMSTIVRMHDPSQ